LQSLQLRLAAREHICRTLQEKVIMMAWAPFNVFLFIYYYYETCGKFIGAVFSFFFCFYCPLNGIFKSFCRLTNNSSYNRFESLRIS
jgi:kinesin family protein C2/C3